MVENSSNILAPQPEGAGRGFKALLAASLAVNLLVIGAVIGALWQGAGHSSRRSSRSSEEFGLISFSRTLAADRAKAVRKIVYGERPDLSPFMKETVEARKAAVAVLTGEPFDAEKLRQSFAGIDQAEMRLKAAAREVVMRSVGTFTAEERQQLATWWQQRKPSLFRFEEKKKRPPKKKKKKSKETTGGTD